jgi:hypothetical protein
VTLPFDYLNPGYSPEIPPAALRNFVGKSLVLFYDLRYSYKQISLIDTDEGADADQEFVHIVYPDEPK